MKNTYFNGSVILNSVKYIHTYERNPLLSLYIYIPYFNKKYTL